MRLQSRSLRQITGRCRDFHAFARTQVEHITHMRARVYRDGQIGGRQKKAEREPYTYMDDTKSRVSLTVKPLHLSLSFLASSSRNPFSYIPRYTISIRFLIPQSVVM